MVAVAQLVESRIVIPVVVGSSPISHPNRFKHLARPQAGLLLFLEDEIPILEDHHRVDFALRLRRRSSTLLTIHHAAYPMVTMVWLSSDAL
jgi:hypothetical protein